MKVGDRIRFAEEQGAYRVQAAWDLIGGLLILGLIVLFKRYRRFFAEFADYMTARTVMNPTKVNDE